MRSRWKQTGLRIRMYVELLSRWSKILIGRSYWHTRVGVGKFFVPGQLLGYYNDYSGKVVWEGPTDAQGIPLNRTVEGNAYYFPLTIIQKALGHWELWLSSGCTDHSQRDQFLKLAEWIVRQQDERGGWPTWPDYGMRSVTPYSAMTQGQAISVLVRAFSISKNETYLEGAAAAVTLMTADIADGGTARYTAEGVVLEEVPSAPPRTVLNGWINGIYGLYDFLLVRRSTDAEEALSDTLAAFVRYLPRYVAKYWSYYDTGGNLASPYYHQRHIAQLKVFERTFPEHAAHLRRTSEIFERQAASRVSRIIAVVGKASQQLWHPPDAVVK